MNQIPYIPESSPFTPEQRMYLNGFLAGLFSRTTAAAIDLTQEASAPTKPLKPLTILFGSQTGTTENLARKVASEAGKRGFVPNVIDMAQYAPENIKQENRLLILTSTYGDGDPPDNARGLWSFLKAEGAPRLGSLEYSVLGLGDTNYEKFCQCAKDFDQCLEILGGKRIHPRFDCDVEYEELFHKWIDGVLPALERSGADASLPQASLPVEAAPEPSRKTDPLGEASAYIFSRKNPFPAKLLTNRKLNGEGSAKDTRHFEISLEGSGFTYEAGDALGVVPCNCSELVEELLVALAYGGQEIVEHGSVNISIREALSLRLEISKIPKSLLETIAMETGDPKLAELVLASSSKSLEKYIYGRGVLDVILEFPKARLSPVEFVKQLRPLQPRLYSISSSPKAHPGEVHLTVAAVRYSSSGRDRKGVCSTFLADRVTGEARVPVFIHTNKAFRPPSDGSKPMIMVGPGTGIAPFRAFLEERRATAVSGKNWLFFGDQHAASDYLYKEELQAMVAEGVLTRLDTAFSRDQEDKIYVQHRIIENASELFSWLEDGAHFYVCGDASRMAKDVDQALHEVIQKEGGRTPAQAIEYVAGLKAQKRYQRDVY